jgi:hypothetical protein
MKTIANIGGILMALSLTTALSQDDKSDLSATSQGAKAETVKREMLSAASREKLANMVSSQKAPDKIVGKRFVLSGPLVALIKSDEPLRTFNPFSASNSKSETPLARVRLDPYLPPPRGIVLFRLGF